MPNKLSEGCAKSTDSMTRAVKSMPDLSSKYQDNSHPSRHTSAAMLNPIDDMPNAASVNTLRNSIVPEFLTVAIVKGADGFGFTIADSSYGQKVKKIIDEPRCKQLQEGDLLCAINGTDVRAFAHVDVVQLLKDCPCNETAEIIVQRGGFFSPNRSKSKSKLRQNDDSNLYNGGTAFHPHSRSNGKGNNSYRSKTPTAELYSSRDKEPVTIARPKTPIVDTRNWPPLPADFQNNSINKKLAQESLNISNPFYNHRPINYNVSNHDVLECNPDRHGNPSWYSDQGRGRDWHNHNFRDVTHFNENMDDSFSKLHIKNPSSDNAHQSFLSLQARSLSMETNKRLTGENKFSFSQDMWHDLNQHVSNANDSSLFHNTVNSNNNSSSIFQNSLTPNGNSSSVYQNSLNTNSSGVTMYQSTLNSNSKNGMFQNSINSNLNNSSLFQNALNQNGNTSFTYQNTSNSSNRTTFQNSLNMSANNSTVFQNANNSLTHTSTLSSNGNNSAMFQNATSPSASNSFYQNTVNANNNSSTVYQNTVNPLINSSSLYQNTLNSSANGNFVYQNTMNKNPIFQNTINSNNSTGVYDNHLYVLNEERFSLENSNSNYMCRQPLYKQDISPYNLTHHTNTSNGVKDSQYNDIIYGNNIHNLYSSHMDNVLRQDQSTHEKHETSFEHELPMSFSSTDNAVRNASLSFLKDESQCPENFQEMNVTLHRQESGFGFRIIGGTEEGSQVAIGHIVPGGAADIDGTLKSGDEILGVDGQRVLNTSHHHVVQLMSAAADNGKVTLHLRRPISAPENSTKSSEFLSSHDVTVTRNVKEGFGFVIISSVNKPGSTIEDESSATASQKAEDVSLDRDDVYQTVILHRGSKGFGFSIRGGREFHNMPLFVLRIADNGPAKMDGKIKVGDQIIEINSISTKQMTHADAIELIRQGGNSVKLLIKRCNQLPSILE